MRSAVGGWELADSGIKKLVKLHIILGERKCTTVTLPSNNDAT